MEKIETDFERLRCRDRKVVTQATSLPPDVVKKSNTLRSRPRKEHKRWNLEKTAAMCQLFAVKSFFFLWLLAFCSDASIGNRVKTARRLRRQVVKEGRCPPWSVIKNCSSLEQCQWDGDCSGTQKCCKSTCETRSCYEPILAIGPGEDACPKDEARIASNKKDPNCLPGRTRFCFKSNCKRCCYHHTTCNPNPELLMTREECQKVLCSRRVCEYPGEVCALDKFNSPRCSCLSKCPTPHPDDEVCGTDGIPYESACELNRTVCILGVTDIKIHNRGGCSPNGAKIEVSAAHKSKQILPAYKQGELTCRFEGDPLSITWSKVGLRGLPNRMIPRMDKLDILDVGMGDSGMYKCMAYDGFSTAEAEINVTVNGPSLPPSKRINMSRADCLQPRGTGYCKRYLVRWYFDGKDGICRPFAYSGCGGNKNNFPSKETCSSSCSHAAGDICNLPMMEGPCRGFMPHWFYNSEKGRCEQFIYGGCSGNANRFNNKKECQQRCMADPLANTPCMRQELEARRNKRLGVFIPRCLPDGGYDPVQCHGAVCFCVDRGGEEVPGTKVGRHQFLNCTGTLRPPPVDGLSPCQKAQQNASLVPFGTSYLIQCKRDGRYEEVQCSGSTGYCWCVDRNGTELVGSKTRGPLKCPALGIRLTLCQRRYLEYSRNPRPDQVIPRCRPDGSFEEIQCRGVTCFCVDPENGRPVKDTDINTLFGEPRCGDPGHGLTLCQRMHQESLSSSKQGINAPQCKSDGGFEEVQCYGPSNECWCVDQLGNELDGTRHIGPLTCTGLGQPLTACQKEYQKLSRRWGQSFSRYVPRCSPDGNYEQVQCARGVCYCVTPEGQEIPGTKIVNSARQPNCTHPDSNITPCEKKRRNSILNSEKYVPFCNPDGSWTEIQCNRSSRHCWRVDTEGHEVSGTRSTDLEKCADFETFSSCRKRLSSWMESSFRDKNFPWCRADGSFNPMQCSGSYCYCVNEKGNELPGTKISVLVGRPVCTYTSGTVTSCQRKFREAPLKYFQGDFVPRCKLNGQYEEVQCDKSTGECWCVDSDGRELPGTRSTEPLKCPTLGTSLSTCQQQYINYAKNPLPGQMNPRCKEDGSFEPVQCQSLDCFCVDQDGNQIKGISLPVRLGKPKCNQSDPVSPCQKNHKKALQLPATPLRFIPTCKHDGRFEEIQCLRATSECWCVDESGKEITGTRTTGYLSCPSTAAALTPCQKEYQDRLRSWILPGHYIPHCTYDGKYEPLQCQGLNCFCVNEHGVELADSRVDLIEGKPNCKGGGYTLTSCQKQFQEYLRRPLPGRFEPRCSNTGAFQDIQCQESSCFCVNREGIEVPDTRKNLALGKPVCPSTAISLTQCQKQLQEAINLPPDPERFVPRCKFDGRYEEVQCQNSTGLCWCVDRDGNKLSITPTNETAICPTIDTQSPCWIRYQQNIKSTSTGSHVPWCRPDGSFSPLQVQASQFFCINDRGDEIAGTSVDISLGLPDCRAATSRGFILTPCQRERARRLHLPLMAGKHVPRCRVDGTYDEVQCDVAAGQCWCADRDGKEIKETRSEGIIRCPGAGNLTSCQKRQNIALELSTSGPDPWNFAPRCRANGGYYQVQCHVSTGQCWCVDINGNELWGTVTRGLPDCSVNITSCQRHRARALGLAENPPPGTYVPQCKPDGSYDDVQCHEYTGLCWCVDENGNEILGTRNWGKPLCSRLPPDHETPIDLGILIDASDSVTKNNWPSMLKFVSSVVNSFDISPRGTHIGIIVFSEDAEVSLYFNTLQGNNLTAENVAKVVNKIQFKEGWTRFDLAMLLAEEELFNEATGMRNEIPKALLLLTSSKQERMQGPYTPLSAAAQGLRDKGISIYVIGIGNKVKVPELLDLSSDYRNLFTAYDFSALGARGIAVTEIIKNETKDGSRDWLCNLAPEPGQLGCLASIPAHYFEAATGECHTFIYSGCGGNANNFPSYEKCMNKCKGVLPSCLAEQKRVSKLGLGHFVPKCKASGRYEDVQCYRETGYCWCVDEYGKELLGTRIKGTPICSLAAGSGEVTPCLKERRKALGFNGVPSIGKFVPDCKPDGGYAEIQCFGNTNFCWCSDEQGYEIAGTHRWGKPKCPAQIRPGVCPFVSDLVRCPDEMTEQSCAEDSDCPESSKCCDCGCERRCTRVSSDEPVEVSACVSEHVKSLSSSCPHVRLSSRLFSKCKPDGSFEEVQCAEPYGICWCVDKDGNEIPETRKTGTPNCTAQVSIKPCQREKKRATTMRSRTPIGLFIASCQPDGSFEQVQCHNMTGKCWCVDKNGNELAGTQQWGKPKCINTDKTMTVCQARREECLDNAPPGHFVPSCKTDGSYDDMQCLQTTGECWCVDRNGNEIPGTRSSGKQDCSFLAWLSPCQIDRHRALGTRGVPVVGVRVPECTADGGYNPIQCHVTTGYCWCVDEYGYEVKGSRIKGRPSCEKEPPCKKESDKVLASFPEPPPGMFVPQCRKDGGYQATQCHGSTGFCWCVDEYGNELAETRERGQLNCSALRDQKLSLCQSRYNKASEVNERGHYVPLCESDGSYKPVQCNSATNECWCVSSGGTEKPETRKIGQPNCDFKEAVKNCSLSPDPGPCEASVPSWFFNSSAGACSVFIYGGCDGNNNRFSSYDECQSNCHGRNLTFCELQREISIGRSDDFIPRCKENGEFEQVQCHRVSGVCWCVDEIGLEIPGTRTTSALPNCNGSHDFTGGRRNR